MVRFEASAGRVGNPILDVTVKRDEAGRGRVRVRAPDGEELVIDLPGGSPIRDGDVFGPSPHGIYYRIQIAPG
jgi:urease accessory protein UreE